MGQSTEIKAVIGLGNPGHKYYFTRHSIGFRVLDVFADQYGAQWQAKDLFELAEIRCNGKTILLIKPQTFMNTSGKVVPFLLKKGIKAENIVVVHDELEKAFGKVLHRQGGSARGHNGLRSIISVLGTDFYRVRCGVGRPEDRNDVSDYVLKRFDESEDDVLEMIGKAIDVLEDLCCVEDD